MAQWCIPAVDAAYVAAMEDVLDLYAEPYDPAYPTVCLDEKPVVFHADARPGLPAAPGRIARYDAAYVRNGTANLFVCVEPLAGYRHIRPTARRTAQDYAHVLKWLVDEAYPDVEYIRVVQDNLNTHTPAALYQTFTPAEARRLLRKLEFHYTPKHGSWLNMAELEIALIARRCLRPRVGDATTLAQRVAAFEDERNRARRRIDWRFTTTQARTKLHRLYPEVQNYMD